LTGPRLPKYDSRSIHLADTALSQPKKHENYYLISRNCLRRSNDFCARRISIARRIDATIAKLPGLHWFDRLSCSREEALLQVNRTSTPATGVWARQVSLP